MIAYLQLLQTCSFKPVRLSQPPFVFLFAHRSLFQESKLRRLAEAAACATALSSDVNYHTLLEDSSMVKFLYDIVKRIGERLLPMEAQRTAGTLLIAFPSSERGQRIVFLPSFSQTLTPSAGGLGVMCISSHYKRKQNRWERFLHYNPNACAGMHQ